MSRGRLRPRRAAPGVATLAAGLLSALLATAPLAAAPAIIGTVGDSLTDEYGEEAYGAYARNWLEQLVRAGVLDAGPTASEAAQPGDTWGEPRRTLYARNWARFGATTAQALALQAPGLASQIPLEGVEYAFVLVGANDFSGFEPAYAALYDGRWSPAQIDAFTAQLVDNLTGILDVLAGTGVALAAGNLPDFGVVIQTGFRADFPVPSRREAVAAAIQQANARLAARALERGIPVVDFFSLLRAIFGEHRAPRAALLIGGVPIALTLADGFGGTTPEAAFVHDGIHFGATIQGVMANAFLEAFRAAYGLEAPWLSEEQILAERGLSYGGEETVQSEIGTYGSFVLDFATAPSAPAVTVPTSRLLLEDDSSRPRPGKAKLRFKATSRGEAPEHRIAPPPTGSEGDPTRYGGVLTVYNGAGATADAVSHRLPAAGWSALRSGGFSYDGGDDPVAQPVADVRVEPDRIEIQAGGAAWGYSLGEEAQGRVAVRLRLGRGGGWCADAPARSERNDRVDRFAARKAAAPIDCAPLPHG